MTKWISCLCMGLLAGSLSCTSTTSVDEHDGEVSGVPEGAILTPYEGVAGLQRAVVKSGDKTISEGDVLKGNMHGTWLQYDDKGLVTSLTTYHSGKRHGVALEFDRQGYVSTKASYFGGNLHGEYKKYKRRALIEERHYDQGKREGWMKKYYTNGTLMEEAPYTGGQLDGIAKWYDQEGNLTIAYEYEAGTLVNKNPDVE